MNERCPTVTIMTGNGPVVINEADYDEEIHTLAGDADKPSEPEAPGAGQGTSVTGSDGASGDTGTGTDTTSPGALADHAAALVAAGTVTDVKLVAKMGRNFFVVNDKGAKVEAEGINAKGYGTEKEAWDAILALGGNA